MEPRVIAQVCWGLSVTHRLLYYAGVSAASALPHLTRTPTDPTSCPSLTAESRKFRTDTRSYINFRSFRNSFNLCEVST